MPRASLRSLACMIALVGCSGRGCRCNPQDDTGAACAEVDRQTWYADQDGDGHGDPGELTSACDAPKGYVATDDDCDDTQASGWQTVARHTDGDGDGFGAGAVVDVCETAAGYADNDQDCDDGFADVYPDAPVTCGDAIDQDCDGVGDCDAPTGTTSASQADARIAGDDAGNLGAALVAADLDGDGATDLGVGAPEENGEGAAYVLYGPILGGYSTSDAGMRMGGLGPSVHVGAALAAGDVDADGNADLLVGAPDGGVGGGGFSSYVILSPLPAIVEIEGENDPIRLTGGGAAIVADHDYVGDAGMAALLLGEGYAEMSRKEGPPSRSKDLTINNDGYMDFGGSLGKSMAMVGDVTGDGVADLGVGAPTSGYGDSVIGEFGNVFLLDSPDLFHVEGDDLPFWSAYILGVAEEGGLFGWSIAPAGDQDGDGYADVAVGAPGVSSSAGAVYIYSGDALSRAGNEDAIPAENALAKISPADEGMQLGYSLSGGTDANGDGTPDLLIGAPGDSDGRGQVTLWYGPLINDVDTDDADYTLTGEIDGDTFGAAVNMLADFNALGRPDLLVGATGVNDGNGAVYLFFTDGL